MAANTYKLEMVNDLQEVERLPEFLDQVVEAVGADPALGFNLNLAIEEALVNVINYAFPDDGQKHPITLEAVCRNAEAAQGERLLTFVLEDGGRAFDPTKADDADVTLSAEDRQIGGLGIFLVRQLMDEVSYERKGEKNVLMMSKKF